MIIRLQALALALAGCAGPELIHPELEPTCELGRHALALSHEPLAFDGEARIEITGAEPGETVHFFWTSAEEPGCTCPDGLEGCVELDQAELLGTGIADDSGSASLTIPIPVDEPVGPRWLQASTGGALSSVIEGMVSGKLGSSLSEQDAHYRVEGEGLGTAVDGVGDVDGDGRVEVAAGAPALGLTHLYRPTAAVRDGGPIDRIEDLDGVVTLAGPVGAGAMVAGVGDLNGDGLHDLMVASDATAWLVHGGLSAGEHDLDKVAVHSVYGSFTGLAAADLDGDARNDLVLATSDSILLSYGDDLAADDEISGLEAPRVARAGDLDGDGLDDLVIASGDEVMLYYGPGILEGGLDLVGATVGTLGDLNGDGYDDGQAASPTAQDGRGVVSIVHGPMNPLAPVLMGTTTGEQVGLAISGAGDIDGDGMAELLASTADGVAMLLYGPADGTRSTVEADVLFEASDEGRALGTALAGAGDLDGDAVDDLIIGGTSGSDGGLYVFRGAPGW